MSSVMRGTGGAFLLIGVLLMAMAFAPTAGGWGSSVHHDQAIIMGNALKNSPSIPAVVRENIDTDTIYAASLTPDDWRDVTGAWGTYQYNMADNAYYEFENIRQAWSENQFDNAIYRIGVAMHYVGDAIQMAHNKDLRKWYTDYIEPIGSEEPLWTSEESGGHYLHMVRHQIEAYSDSDSAWYPREPENYGTRNGSTDDGSLDWFLTNYFYDPGVDNDSPDSDNGLVMVRHIRETSPYVDWSDDDKVDNRWFYWVETRDPDISKMDFDNSTRLTYNGAYRALRDGHYRSVEGVTGNPPSDWSRWPWPTPTRWESPRAYGEGYDSIRWAEGRATYGSKGGESEQGVGVPGAPGAGASWFLLVLGSVVAAIGVWHVWRQRQGRIDRSKSGGGRRRA